MGHRTNSSEHRRSSVFDAVRSLEVGRQNWGNDVHPETTLDLAVQANNLHAQVYGEGVIRQVSRRTEAALHAAARLSVEQSLTSIGYVS